MTIESDNTKPSVIVGDASILQSQIEALGEKVDEAQAILVRLHDYILSMFCSAQYQDPERVQDIADEAFDLADDLPAKIDEISDGIFDLIGEEEVSESPGDGAQALQDVISEMQDNK